MTIKRIKLLPLPFACPRWVIAGILIAWPQLMFWIVSQYLFMSRPVVNLDYMGALAAVKIAPLLGGLLYLAVFTIDIVASFSSTYFFEPLDFIGAGGFLRYFNLTELAASIDVALLVLLVAASILFTIRFRTALNVSTLALTSLLVLSADVANGSFDTLGGKGGLTFPVNVGGSRLWTIARRIQVLGDTKSEILATLPSAASVTGQHSQLIGDAIRNGRNVLIIVVESLGKSRNHLLNDLVRSALIDDNLLDLYAAKAGKIGVSGATTKAELRELCHWKGDYRKITQSEAKIACLPWLFRAQGYETVAYHGFSSGMFDRAVWYPKIGFVKAYFAADLMEANGRLCGGIFRGICDNDIVKRLREDLLLPKRFVYFLTLNSHLPTSPGESDEDFSRRCKSLGEPNNICDLSSIHRSLYQTLHAMLLDSHIKPLVIVVGDHAPPYMDNASRSEFDPTSVPYIVLIPK